MPDSAYQSHAGAEPDFMQVQRTLAAHLRDPDGQAPPPGIEARRLRIYRELVFNNLSSLLGQGFPVLHACLGSIRWQALVRGFLREHRASTPLFPEIGQEWLAYLSTSRADVPDDPPYLFELAHYEWVETALLFSELDAGPALADPNGDLLQGAPVVSPLAWSLTYRFAVHAIDPADPPRTPPREPTHLVAYRDRRERVAFLQVNAVTARLLELLREGHHRSGRQVLVMIGEELGLARPDQLLAAGDSLLTDLRERQILLGTARTGGMHA
ncbi:hypothetical protein Thiowin_02502 [Thiorhodovibrio winogradskyi]|uniref:DNA-binding domain-containing protein n=1 Tax=Thiorhodovibrio winogradskyi TaxID=77007 RepID=A0ABZ0S8T8_9GAMM|nr:putative DNA-binding domain-containing protein [Thiorhodovibrio winogradskyi]